MPGNEKEKKAHGGKCNDNSEIVNCTKVIGLTLD